MSNFILNSSHRDAIALDGEDRRYLKFSAPSQREAQSGMKIIKAYPPMIDEIDAMFNVKGKAIFYAWGDVIYNPKGVDISPELLAHERAHGERQKGGVELWWHKYIHDPEFRLAEELVAHAVEYRHALKHGNRLTRRKALKVITARLASPMYGRMIGMKQAKHVIECMVEL